LVFNKQIYDYTIEIIKNKKTKTITIISIGDSPVIFLLIFKKIFCNKNNINLKFLEISGLSNITKKEKEIGVKKLSNIENFIETDYILWVDFINTGDSFYNFLELLPKHILKKSYFFIYGDTDIKEHNRHKELKNINFLFYDIYCNSVFWYFIADKIGHCEQNFMRCVNNKKIDKDYKLELFDISDIPLQKNIYGEHCINFFNFLYDSITRKYRNFL
jgi:hypothetical protein